MSSILLHHFARFLLSLFVHTRYNSTVFNYVLYKLIQFFVSLYVQVETTEYLIPVFNPYPLTLSTPTT